MRGSICYRTGKEKERNGTWWRTYVRVPCLELSSELVNIGTLAGNQRDVVSSLGKEASDEVNN